MYKKFNEIEVLICQILIQRQIFIDIYIETHTICFTVMTRLYYAAKYKRLEYETALSGQLLKTWLADLSSSIIAKHNKESTFVTLLWLETTTA